MILIIYNYYINYSKFKIWYVFKTFNKTSTMLNICNDFKYTNKIQSNCFMIWHDFTGLIKLLIVVRVCQIFGYIIIMLMIDFDFLDFARFQDFADLQ